jgi:hypothetical protein
MGKENQGASRRPEEDKSVVVKDAVPSIREEPQQQRRDEEQQQQPEASCSAPLRGGVTSAGIPAHHFGATAGIQRLIDDKVEVSTGIKGTRSREGG